MVASRRADNFSLASDTRYFAAQPTVGGFVRVARSIDGRSRFVPYNDELAQRIRILVIVKGAAMFKKIDLAQLEEFFEGIFFKTRWALVPGYVVLIVSLALLVYKTVLETWQLLLDLPAIDENGTVVRVLGVVDIVLVMNLVLMVIFVGYVNFVSKIHFHQSEDKPQWLDKLSYSGLKVQMMGSILAISSVKMLRAYFSVGSPDGMSKGDLQWLAIIYATFIFALMCVAVTNRLQGHSE